ncbi:MAG: DUF6273 domain-containing protein [bacterium]|nr:DUF6273 domain-containing protein [bacterium]
MEDFTSDNVKQALEQLGEKIRQDRDLCANFQMLRSILGDFAALNLKLKNIMLVAAEEHIHEEIIDNEKLGKDDILSFAKKLVARSNLHELEAVNAVGAWFVVLGKCNPEDVIHVLDKKSTMLSKSCAKKKRFKIVLSLLIISYIVSIFYCCHLARGYYSSYDSFKFSQCAKGDIVYFGRYPQSESSPEPIQWIVVSNDGDTSTLLSLVCLDSMPFHDKFESVTWENSLIRKWLNTDFIDRAFNENEKKCLAPCRQPNVGNPVTGIPGGGATLDPVFLLSVQEVDSLLEPTWNKAETTAFVEQKGIEFLDNIYCCYWLRTPGNNLYNAAAVLPQGQIDYNGRFCCNAHPVRPAVRLKSHFKVKYPHKQTIIDETEWTITDYDKQFRYRKVLQRPEHE